jgi:hypothetical protein
LRAIERRTIAYHALLNRDKLKIRHQNQVRGLSGDC